jgi:hypothetical protein
MCQDILSNVIFKLKIDCPPFLTKQEKRFLEKRFLEKRSKRPKITGWGRRGNLGFPTKKLKYIFIILFSIN